MRTFRFLNLAILSVMVGSAALVFAQEEKKDDTARHEEAKPQPKQDEGKPSRQEEAKPTKQEKQEQSHDQAMPEKQEHSNMHADHDRKTQDHAEQHTSQGHAAGKGGHIPDDKFHAHFGQSHHFNAKTVIVVGQPQFVYGGYNFEFIDAWPADWAYTDDVYIDYIEGEYFLFDVLHPGVRVAVFVVL